MRQAEDSSFQNGGRGGLCDKVTPSTDLAVVGEELRSDHGAPRPVKTSEEPLREKTDVGLVRVGEASCSVPVGEALPAKGETSRDGVPGFLPPALSPFS